MAKVLLHGGHLLEVTETRAQVIAAVTAEITGNFIPPLSTVTGTLVGGGSVTVYTRQILGVSD